MSDLEKKFYIKIVCDNEDLTKFYFGNAASHYPQYYSEVDFDRSYSSNFVYANPIVKNPYFSSSNKEILLMTEKEAKTKIIDIKMDGYFKEGKGEKIVIEEFK